jgi:ribonuclease HI
VQENAVVPNRAVKVSPSNNRGELLGIIYAMNYFLNEYAYGCIEIISDSNISINTLTDWLPTRLANGTEHELKNFDLVMIAWNLLNRLRKQALHVKFTHCKAHQPTPADDTPRERFIHMGNGLADYHATEVLKQRPSVDTKQIEILQLSTS